MLLLRENKKARETRSKQSDFRNFCCNITTWVSIPFWNSQVVWDGKPGMSLRKWRNNYLYLCCHPCLLLDLCLPDQNTNIGNVHDRYRAISITAFLQLVFQLLVPVSFQILALSGHWSHKVECYCTVTPVLESSNDFDSLNISTFEIAYRDEPNSEQPSRPNKSTSSSEVTSWVWKWQTVVMYGVNVRCNLSMLHLHISLSSAQQFCNKPTLCNYNLLWNQTKFCLFLHMFCLRYLTSWVKTGTTFFPSLQHKLFPF